MAQVESSALRRTPLYARHVALGARMVPFGGWEMPVEYSGITDEHLAVRTRAGLFDVSHMGQIEVAGRDALAGIQRITSNDAAKLAIGQAQYAALTTERGAFVDDLLVYRLASDHFLLVVNASNIEKDFAWIAAGRGRRRRCRRGQHQRAVRPDCDAGAGFSRGAAAADRRRSGDEVLLVCHRRGRRSAGHHLAHRLHR